MKNNDYIIRLETKNDYKKTENLVREAFWNVYRPGCLEHYVLNQLRNNKDYVRQLAFVMERNGEIIGQNVFVRAEIKTDSGKKLPIMTMGPISIAPKLQKKGYCKILLDYSLEKAKELGCGAVCFEGNINFYGKSGFSFARNYHIRYDGLPDGEDDSFFLCKELISGYLDGISGVYSTPKCYQINEADAENFDKSFVHKKKLKLPGQLFD